MTGYYSQILLSRFRCHPNFMDDKLNSIVKAILQLEIVHTPILCPVPTCFLPRFKQHETNSRLNYWIQVSLWQQKKIFIKHITLKGHLYLLGTRWESYLKHKHWSSISISHSPKFLVFCFYFQSEFFWKMLDFPHTKREN
jgi:hypothetical protein